MRIAFSKFATDKFKEPSANCLLKALPFSQPVNSVCAQEVYVSDLRVEKHMWYSIKSILFAQGIPESFKLRPLPLPVRSV